MNRTLIFALLGTVALACTPVEDPESNSDTAPADDDDDMGTTTEPIPDPSVGNTGINTSGQEGTSSDDGNQMDSTGNAFFVEPDGGGPVVECDVWDQDCPKGEKCMPWANDGGNSWNATRCSEIADNPGQVGDECTVEGSGVSGVDSCDESAMCYYVDPETGVGTCVGFCEGSPDNPMCEPGFLCAIANNGVLILCRRECDPLLQDCQGSAACLPAAGSDGFVCIVDASGETGAAGDPCEFINACDPGLTCTVAENVPGCMGAGCCTEFCDLTEVDPDAACTQAGQGCVSWFEKGNAPPMLDHVGFCALPM